MSWIIKADAKVIRTEEDSLFMVGDYVTALGNYSNLRYSHDTEHWLVTGGIGRGGVWRITDTQLNGDSNIYRAQVVSPSTNGISIEFNNETQPFQRVDNYTDAIR